MKTEKQQASPSLSSPGELLFLIGCRGSGKSTVAPALGERLARPWIDMDAEIEKGFGGSIEGIFELEGEKGFRDRESAVLESICKGSSVIISTGGGVIMREKNRTLMKARGLSVWLTATPETLQSRMSGDPSTAQRRPSLLEDARSPLDEIKAVLREREELYRDVADFEVSTEDHSIEAIVDHIYRLVSKPLCGNAITVKQ